MNPDQLRDPLARRSFVEFCARAAFGLTVLPAGIQQAFGAAKGAGKSAAPASSASAGKGPGFGAAKHVIMLFMDGGMSHIDSYDPKTGPTKGPGSAISTKGDFQLTSFFLKRRRSATRSPWCVRCPPRWVCTIAPAT